MNTQPKTPCDYSLNDIILLAKYGSLLTLGIVALIPLAFCLSMSYRLQDKQN